MWFLRGATVVVGSIFWLCALVPLVGLETIRYGIETFLEMVEDVFIRWDAWVNERRAS